MSAAAGSFDPVLEIVKKKIALPAWLVLPRNRITTRASRWCYPTMPHEAPGNPLPAGDESHWSQLYGKAPSLQQSQRGRTQRSTPSRWHSRQHQTRQHDKATGNPRYIEQHTTHWWISKRALSSQLWHNGLCRDTRPAPRFIQDETTRLPALAV